MGVRLDARSKFIIQGTSVLVVLTLLVLTMTLILRSPAPGDPNIEPTIGGGNDVHMIPPPPAAAAAADQNDSSPFGSFRYAAVAADGQPCSTVGVKILAEKRGSAVDAAIATMLCIGVINCHNSGIGGGHFMTIYDTPRGGSEKEMMTVIARERAPAAATEDMFVNHPDPEVSTDGGLAIAVPGEVKGFHLAWQRYGLADWSDLFTDTIQLCRDGFAVNSALGGAIQQYELKIRRDPNLSAMFVKDNGQLVQEGDIIRNPNLAATLETIANDPDAFYNPASKLAQDIVADIQDYDGIITVEDLGSYEAYLKPPKEVRLQNGGYNVYAPTAPSSGVVYEYILNILDGYNMTPSSMNGTEEEILTYHRITEAFKFAYAKRSALGDEEFWDVQELLQNMTSETYADAIRARIDDTRTYGVEYYEPEFGLVSDKGTAHASIYAPDGGAVAITCTINLFFGAKVLGNRTGIFFNDEMDDFSTPNTTNAFGVPASPSNFIAPGKMPMSSMTPSVIRDDGGRVRFMSGAAGGTTITTVTSFVTMGALWFGDRVDAATDAPRIHHQLVPNEIEVEAGFSQEVANGLRQKGHNVTFVNSIASVQSIHNVCVNGSSVPENCIHAVSDGRKAGVPDGF